MRDRYLLQEPWWQVGLAVLPGLILLLGEVPGLFGSTTLRLIALAIVVLVAVSSIAVAVAHRSLLKVPAWGLVALGCLAGMGSMWTIEYLGFYATCGLLVVTGLLFAAHNGVAAGLFVLAAGVLAATWAAEPTMYFRGSAFWRGFVNTGMIIVFTIVAPVWVLRSRTAWGQAVGLLVPLDGYIAAYVYAKYSTCGIAIGQSLSARDPFLILLVTVAVAAVAYGWLRTGLSARRRMPGPARAQ